MSAICGIFRAGDRPVPEDALDRMMQASALHGPDGSRTWRDDCVEIGQQTMFLGAEARAERLPVHLPERKMALVFDGRLHNRDELVAALGLPRHEPLSDSDLLIAAWDAWGSRCAERLVGEFAFALWNARDRALHLVTDPMGVRPLFYRELPGGLAFATHVETLLAATPRRAPLNDRRLAMLGVSALTVYLEPEMTCFEGIWRVPPASLMTASAGGKRVKVYWRPDPAKRLTFGSEEDCHEAFQEVFSAAIDARLRGVHPVASLLSGGLDSSAIAAKMAGQSGSSADGRLAICFVPEESSRARVNGEMTYIEQMTKWTGLDARLVSAPGRGPFDDLRRLTASASLPSYSYQHFLYTAIVREAADAGARLILDGDGGELAASTYPRGYFAELFLRGRWQLLAGELHSSGRAHRIGWPQVRHHVLRPLVPRTVLKMFGRQAAFRHLLPWPLRATFVRETLRDEIAEIRDRVQRLAHDFPDHRRNMARDIELEMNDLRQRSHAGFVDHHRAAFSYPFMDKRIIEFGLAIDGRFHFRDGLGRRLLRDSMRGLIPDSVRLRTDKVPFCADYPMRFEKGKAQAEDELRHFADSTVLAEFVDFPGAIEALESAGETGCQDPMEQDPATQHIIPSALYLCYFLDEFGMSPTAPTERGEP